MIIIWTSLVDLESTMLYTYTQVQSKSFLGFGEEVFICFLPYIGMAANWFNRVGPFEQIFNILSTEGSMLNLAKMAFKDYMNLNMYKAKGV